MPTSQFPELDAYADTFFKQQDADTASQIRSNAASSSAVNPDMDAQHQALAKSLKVPVDIVRQDPATMKQQAIASQIPADDIVAKTPKTAKFLTNPDYMNISKDDIDNLQALEHTMNPDRGLMGDVFQGVASTGLKVSGALGKVAVALDDMLPESMRATAQERQEYLDSQNLQLEAGTEGAPKHWTGQVAAGLAYAPFGVTAPLITAGAEGAAAKQDLINKGVDEDTATKVGYTEGGLQGLIQLLPLGKLGFGQGGAALAKSVAGAATKAGMAGAAQSVLGDTTAGVMLADKGYGDLAEQYMPSLSKAADSALFMAGLHVGVQGAHALAGQLTSNVLAGEVKVEKAQKDAEFVQQLNDLAASSKLRPRSQEAFNDFVTRASEDGPVQDLYVDTAGLAQSGVDINELAKALPSVAEQLTTTAPAGGDVKIPVADFATHLAGTDLGQSLMEHIKTDPDGFTKAQADEFYQNHAEELKAQVERVLAEKQGDDTFKASQQVVHDNIMAQLKEANRFTDDVNTPYATLMSNFYAVQAARLGVTPEQLFAQHPVKIQAESPVSGGQLDQAGGLLPPHLVRYMRDVDRVLQSGYNSGTTMLHMGRTPEALVAAGLPEGDLRISHRIVRKATQDKHSVSDTVLKRLPALLADPLMVHESATVEGDYVAVIDAKDAKGSPVIVSLHPGKEGLSVNDISSVYGKDNTKWFSDQISEGRLRYINEEKSLAWSRLNQLQLPEWKPLSPANSGEQGSARNILTEKDIVKPLEQGEGSKRGSYSPSTDTITLLKNADLSTFLHESGHFFLETMNKLALREDAPAEIKKDMQTTLDWLGAKDMTEWNARDLEGKREAHEQFARGFEAYLFEGKSPSLEMQGVFQRFRAWLTNVYRNLRNLNVELTDGVRSVFDRMLATTDQIKDAELARHFEPMFKNPEDAKMLPDEFKRYHDLGVQATQDAITDLESRSLRDMKYLSGAREGVLRKLQKEAATKRAAVRREVTDEVMNEPVNRARTFLKRGEVNGEKVEGPHKLNIDDVARMEHLPLEALQSKYGKYGFLGKDGLHPDLVAEMFGFDSGTELVEALILGENPRDKIAGLTDQRMLERYGDLTDPRALSEAADKAIHNEARTKFIATEANALQKALGGKKIMTQAAKEFAENLIARLKVRNVKPNEYTSAETRAAVKAEKARAKGDVAAAATEKRNQLIQNYAARAARTALDDVEKGVNYLKRFSRTPTREAVGHKEMAQIDALLDRFDLRTGQSLKAIDRRTSLREWAQAQIDKGLDPAVDDRLLDEAQRISYKDMSVEAFRGLIDTVKSIEHLGRFRQRLLDNKEMRDFNAIVEEAVNHLKTLPQRDLPEARNPGEGGKGLDKINAKLLNVGGALRSADASFLKMEQMFDWLDSHNSEGVFNRIVFKRIADAQGKEHDLTAPLVSKLRELANAIPEEAQKDFLTRYTLPELIDSRTGKPSSMLKSEILAMALNTGNRGNFEKMLAGEKWTAQGVKAVLDRTMSKGEWDFVQGVWDTVESLWPHIEAMETRLSGVAPPKVERTPVETPHGTYSGGYYPLVYDPLRSYDVDQRNERSGDKLFENNYTRATTPKGHTIERSDNFARPLLLKLDVLPRHLSQVVHDLAYREAIIDADRFLADGRIRSGIEGALGREYYEQLRPWLQAIANDKVYDSKGLAFWDKAAHWSRTSSTMVGLGYRLTTMLIHGGTALSNSVGEIGPKWMASGVKSFFGSPQKMADTRDFVYARSAEMRNRMNEIDRDVRDALREMETNSATGPAGAAEKGLRAVKQFAYYGISALDMGSAMPTWMGAYNKGLSEGLSEDKAIYYADKAVRNAHGGGGVKDLAAIQRGTEFQKLFTMFYSFWNHFYNRQRDIARTAMSIPETYRSGDTPQAAKDFGMVLSRSLFYFVIPQLLHAAIKAPSKKDDHPEGWLKWAAEEIALGLFSGIPVVRDVANSAATGRDYTATPAAQVVTALGKTAKDIAAKIHGDAVSDKWLKHSVTTAGYVFGLPTGQAATTTQFLWDVMSGHQNPSGMADWYHGVVHGQTHPH